MQFCLIKFLVPRESLAILLILVLTQTTGRGRLRLRGSNRSCRWASSSRSSAALTTETSALTARRAPLSAAEASVIATTTIAESTLTLALTKTPAVAIAIATPVVTAIATVLTVHTRPIPTCPIGLARTAMTKVAALLPISIVAIVVAKPSALVPLPVSIVTALLGSAVLAAVVAPPSVSRILATRSIAIPAAARRTICVSSALRPHFRLCDLRFWLLFAALVLPLTHLLFSFLCPTLCRALFHIGKKAFNLADHVVIHDAHMIGHRHIKPSQNGQYLFA
ncbi:hypothetical protein URH17368_1666 [Alicyclobacillus hesperidum URH17-3-68]|nr:hypothetical protein URH17368_1666 [Alicyclobacillus hesperidum URH17-3-68]